MPDTPLPADPSTAPVTVFGALLSPYVRKVCVVAAEKGIAYQLKLSRPRNPDPDFLAASPFGKIPAMKHGDFHLSDSSAMIAYFEAAFPQTPVIPAEACARGRTVWFDEFADTLLSPPALKVLFNRHVAPVVFKQPGNEDIARQGLAALPPLWDYLEAQLAPELAERGWLVGDFSLADIAVAVMIRSLEHVDGAPDPALWPQITAWYARVCARKSWQQVAQEDLVKV